VVEASENLSIIKSQNIKSLQIILSC